MPIKFLFTPKKSIEPKFNPNEIGADINIRLSLCMDYKLLSVGMVNVPCQGKVSIGTWNTGTSVVYKRGYAAKTY